MKANQLNCQNCEEPFEEGFKFCPNCGQKTDEKLTIGVLFYNTISNYFSFDARFLKSFFPLLFKPGHLANRFLEGKRLLYLHPAQMYLFVSVIFFFLFSFTVNDFIEEANKTNEKLSTSEGFKIIDDKQQKALDSIMKSALKKPLMVDGDSINLPQNETQKLVDSISSSLSKNTGPSSMNLGINKKRLDSLRSAGLDENAIYKEMGMEDDANFLSCELIVLFNSEPSDVPQNVTVVALNASSAYLSWIPPPLEDRNGIIIGYVVRVSGVNTDEEIELSVVDLHTTVVGLHPFYSYRFSVAAVTVATGPFNNPIGLSLPESGTQLYIKKVW